MVNYYVYILFSHALNRFYVGETVDIKDRLEKHNSGFYTKSFTSKANDWELFLKIQCDDRKHARKIESHIKNMKSKTYIKNLGKYPEMIDRLLIKY